MTEAGRKEDDRDFALATAQRGSAPRIEFCLKMGGHCWQYATSSLCISDDPEYPTDLRTCKHCGASETRKWQDSR